MVLTIFLGFLFFVSVLIIIAVLLAIFGKKSKATPPSYSSTNQVAPSTCSQNEKDIIEDSEGDGLMLFDDPMFPPEFDDENDDP